MCSLSPNTSWEINRYSVTLIIVEHMLLNTGSIITGRANGKGKCTMLTFILPWLLHRLIPWNWLSRVISPSAEQVICVIEWTNPCVTQWRQSNERGQLRRENVDILEHHYSTKVLMWRQSGQRFRYPGCPRARHRNILTRQFECSTFVMIMNTRSEMTVQRHKFTNSLP